MEYIPISWSKLHADTSLLAAKIAKAGTGYDAIVAIARGGLTVAHMLSDYLTLPVMSLTISSYKSPDKRHKPQVIYDVGASLYSKRLLLVDDIADTGETFMFAKTYAFNREAASVHTAAPYIKPHSSFLPDYYVESLTGWVIYPYEIKESIQSLSRLWHGEGLNKQDAVSRLRSLGFTDPDITAFYPL